MRDETIETIFVPEDSPEASVLKAIRELREGRVAYCADDAGPATVTFRSVTSPFDSE
jgi:hypothetical protein